MTRPSPQLLDLLADCSPGVTELALALRDLVLTEAPEAEELLYSVYAEVIVFKLPVGKRGAFCYIAAYTDHVNLGFYLGADLPDPHRALKGTGKKMRHIRFDSPNDLRHRYLRNYIRSAAELAGPEMAKSIQLQIEYAPAPPFDAGSPEAAPPSVVAQLRDRNAALADQRRQIVKAAAERVAAS